MDEDVRFMNIFSYMIKCGVNWECAIYGHIMNVGLLNDLLLPCFSVLTHPHLYTTCSGVKDNEIIL